MKHLYDNGDGELVVADSLEQAHLYHDVELGGEKNSKILAELRESWFQVDDEAEVPILLGEENNTDYEKKKAKEWAAEFDRPSQIATTYW